MDPSSRFYKGIVIGFGIAYISSIKAYKLALFFEKENEDETNQRYPSFNCQVIEISSLDCSNRNFSEWRIIEDTFHDYVNNVHAPVTVENTSYWRACTYDHIISFDFENEIFGIINYPKEIDYFNGNDIMCLLDLHGKLGLAELCSNNEDCFTMVVWNLHDQCSNNWEKVYRFSVEDTGLNSIRKLSCMYLHDEEILISSRDCLIFYNLKNNTYKMLDYSAIYSLVGFASESILTHPDSLLPHRNRFLRTLLHQPSSQRFMENWTEKTVTALYTGNLVHKNNWHAIKADPRFGPWLVDFSADDLRNKVKADIDMIAKVQPTGLNQEGMSGVNQPKNIWQKIKAHPKFGPILSGKSEEDIENKLKADLEFFGVNLSANDYRDKADSHFGPLLVERDAYSCSLKYQHDLDKLQRDILAKQHQQAGQDTDVPEPVCARGAGGETTRGARARGKKKGCHR
ncbi:hypothetical protein P8452_10745 [Trifolium repens]|nr:hypothetical protein P8452_10745 [Trifolium repens]